MRTWYLKTIMAGLIGVTLAAGQELSPPKVLLPVPGPPAIVPADGFPETGTSPPAVLPVPQPVDPAQTVPGGTGPFALPPLMPPAEDDYPEGPPVPDPYIYPLNRVWFSATYLHWWAKDDLVPPLVTLGSPGNTIPGAIGQPGTRVILANIDDEESRSGIRMNLGVALDPMALTSLDFSFLYLAQRRASFSAPPGTNQVLARPYFDPVTGTENAFVVFNPGVVQGTFTAISRTDIFGGEVNYRIRRPHAPGNSYNFLGGLRYFQLNDTLRINETSTIAATTPARADILTRFDQFNTANRFFGAQVGLEAEWFMYRFFCNIYGKIAAGITHEDVSIRGGTAASSFAGTTFAPINAGFLATQTNSGDFSQGRFGLLGDFGFTVGYQVTDYCRVSVGYERLYWNAVARAGQQISRSVNPTQFTSTGIPGTLVGPISPAFIFRETDFWVQGVNFTLELRY